MSQFILPDELDVEYYRGQITQISTCSMTTIFVCTTLHMAEQKDVCVLPLR
jgi:hypothetical protein